MLKYYQRHFMGAQMNYMPKQNRASENFAGLALVVAMHVVIAYFVATTVIDGIKTAHPPQPIDIVNVDPPHKLPAPIVDRVQTVKPMLSSEPVILDQSILINDPLVGQVPDRSADVGVRQNPQTGTVAPQASTGVVATGALGVACPNAQRVREDMRYPVAARREGIQGDVLVRFLVGMTGEIKNINVVNSSNRALSNAAVAAIKQFSCAGQGQDVLVEVPFSFRLSN